MTDWQPFPAHALRERLADALAAAAPMTAGAVRLAVDGAPCTGPDQFAESLIAPLNARGRPVAHVRASSFWHDASLRLEHGHQDLQSYPSWLDAEALRREVLEPVRVCGTYLPSLRDPRTNRSTRAAARSLAEGGVLIVSGGLLLGRGLPFDRTVHLYAPSDQLLRDTPAAEQWTLPAYSEYERTVAPAGLADVVVRARRRSLVARGL